MVIRAMYLNYDHLSDLCELYEDLPTDQLLNSDLFNYCKEEFREKLQYKFDNRQIVKKRIKIKKETMENEENEEEHEDQYEEIEVFDELGMFEDIRLVPYQKLSPTASEFVLNKEESYLNKIRNKFTITLDDHIINLRKFSILGGVFILNLLKLPPQPQEFVTIEMKITPGSPKFPHKSFWGNI